MSSPQNDHLNTFENDLYDLIQKVEFTHVQNTFQENLKKDIQNIKSLTKMLVFADKSTNLYDLSRDHYDKLLHDNITQLVHKQRKILTRNQTNLRNDLTSTKKWNVTQTKMHP